MENFATGVRAVYAVRENGPGCSSIPVAWCTRRVIAAHRRAGQIFHKSSQEEPEMGDVIYVVLVVATFAVLALVVKGVERLER